MNEKILITTIPFGKKNTAPIETLEKSGIPYVINPIGRKLKEDELAEMIGEYTAIIAGTEPITKKVLKNAKNLKIISRVGIGLDSVDLMAAKNSQIAVSYTPDAPAPAVAELTIGLMLSLLRNIHLANLTMHQKQWNRFFGKRISECTIGIIGVGRIGKKVIQHLQGFPGVKILANDLKPDIEFGKKHNLRWVEKEEIYKISDIISLHVPLKEDTRNLITMKEILLLKNDVSLINTSRGGIVHETDLAQALNLKKISNAAIDVFEKEPYDGPLTNIENCLLTSHMGSMSIDCRNRMEIEATEEVLNYLIYGKQQNPVPEFEYKYLSTLDGN